MILVEACWNIPLEAVNVMTTILPKMEKAIMPDTTREAKSVPKTSLKNTVAMSRLSYSRSSTETAQSYEDVSAFMILSRREIVQRLC